ncbi:MAG: L,D-transpeptidase, partial [Bdellovibrionales bacterium]|nr:L,D-transpeptidase [Bdellovibrionales bacterium]
MKFAKHRLHAFFFAIAVLAGTSGCGPSDSTEALPPDEPTPDELAKELGVPNEPGSRELGPKDFARYSLVVDVFRRSTSKPVLGAFDPRYVDLLLPADGDSPDSRLARAKTEFADLARREFAVVSVDGKVRKAQIVSGALEGYAEGGYRRTPPGAYKLDILRYAKKVPDGSGGTRVADVDYPWLRSQSYGNSIMYWGLWIFGGYFIHSTTHYGLLGSPASMGCIRQSYPDAMELFKLRQTHLGMIRIHPIGSQQAYDRLRELASPDWALLQLAENRRRIDEYVDYAGKTEISVPGHAWIDPTTGRPGTVDWPDCGPVDCFTIWGRKLPFADAAESIF